MDKKLRLLESFAARGNDGKTYKVRVYEHLGAVATLGAESEAWEPTGLAEYKLADGEHVAVDKTGALSIAGTGVRLQRV